MYILLLSFSRNSLYVSYSAEICVIKMHSGRGCFRYLGDGDIYSHRSQSLIKLTYFDSTTPKYQNQATFAHLRSSKLEQTLYQKRTRSSCRIQNSRAYPK